MRLYIKYTIYLLCITGIWGCNLEKEIEVEIPFFEEGYVVESYLAPESPFGLLITKSQGFFETFDIADYDPNEISGFFVQGVEGYIEVNGNRYALVNEYKINPRTSSFYNYILDEELRFRPNDKIELSLTFPSGVNATAVTQIPETRPLDSVRIDIDRTQEMEARETTFISSDSTRVEYFRRQLIRIHQGEATILQDFVIDNSLAKGGRLAFGSGYEFTAGDTLISKMIHIDKNYNDFIQSVTGSISANSGPFSQPGRIISNIRGSDQVIGIFTGINQSEIFMKLD